MQLDIQQEETEKLREALRYHEIENQDLKNTIVQLRSEAEMAVRRHLNEVKALREQQESAHQREVTELNRQYDEIIMRIKAKYEEKKQEVKEVKAKVKALITKVQEDEAAKWEEERRQLLLRADGSERVKELEMLLEERD